MPNRFIPDYGINSILFQRGIYPAETFESHQQYGLTILMSTEAKIKDFLQTVLKQTEGIIQTARSILFSQLLTGCFCLSNRLAVKK